MFAMVAALGMLSACSGGDAEAGGGGSAGTRGVGGSGGTQPRGVSFDRSRISFVDNLLVKVAEGDWTLGEGLVATLEVMAGERNAASILRHAKLLDHEGTGILVMADEYLEDGPDEEAKAEIAHLLDRIIFSAERLEAMASLGEPDPAPTSTKASPVAPKGSIEDCLQFFTGYNQLPPGVGPCLKEQSPPKLDAQYPGQFRVYGPGPPFPDAGWTQRYYDLVVDALEKAVPKYKTMGQLTTARIVLSATRLDGEGADVSAGAFPKIGRPCGIVLFTTMQSNTDGDFKQIIAHELAHCFQKETFTAQTLVKHEYTAWREEGLANYLSNLVYPDNNIEWGEPPARRSSLLILAESELTSTILERAYTNSIFFQYLGNRLGDEGLFALIRRLPGTPGTGPVEQAAALAAYPNMVNIYHDFAKDMTDKKIVDTSGLLIPYDLSEENRPTADLTGPHLIKRGLDPFSVSRRRLTIGEAKQAELTYRPVGNVEESARPTDGGEWKSIPSKLPAPECFPEVIVVVTSIEPNTGYELEAAEPEDTEAACGIVGTWVVQNSSLRFDPGSWMLTSLGGQISITFDADGNAEVVYSAFSYGFVKDTQLDIGGIPTLRHEELTYTTNASGTTTYEVDGDYIEFGDFFEGSYLVGTEQVHQVNKHSPMLPGGDLDEVRQRDDADGIGLFGGDVKFQLRPGGIVMSILGPNDRVEAVLNRTESVSQ
jgi:hypothetical protein